MRPTTAVITLLGLIAPWGGASYAYVDVRAGKATGHAEVKETSSSTKFAGTSADAGFGIVTGGPKTVCFVPHVNMQMLENKHDSDGGEKETLSLIGGGLRIDLGNTQTNKFSEAFLGLTSHIANVERTGDKEVKQRYTGYGIEGGLTLKLPLGPFEPLLGYHGFYHQFTGGKRTDENASVDQELFGFSLTGYMLLAGLRIGF